MDICDLGKANREEYFGSVVYFILMIEYSILLVFLAILWRNSYINTIYNLVEYRNYLILIVISSIIKIAMFFDTCVPYGDTTMILIVAYELPYVSSETLLIYLW